MSGHRETLLETYAGNLREYLEGGEEAVLKRAYELARAAMEDGVGVLEMAVLHQEAMTRMILGAATPNEGAQAIKAAEVVLVESLSPFEMTHRAFRESTIALRRLNDRLEDEARRIAHALHAEAGQLLASVHIALDRIASQIPETRSPLAEVDDLLIQVSKQLRRLSHELRPTILDDLGLMPALSFLAEGVSTRSSIPVAIEGNLEKRLPPAIETAIYRAVQEALNNMNRHAGATRARVHVNQEAGRVICTVQDDGKGFDSAAVLDGKGPRGLGLLGIRERMNALGGTLQISSSPGKGTAMRVTIPTEG
ncbi:MAG: sensor histidine kinase [Candidatus Polarisedimenticolia bacterium]